MKDLQEWLQYLHLDFIQLLVLVLGVSEVLLARANNIWLYPTGIASIILSIYSLLNVKLYAECILHMYYLVMSVYGWHYWIAKKDGRTIEITRTTNKEKFITLAIVIAGWVLLYFFLIGFTNSENPVWDAWVSCTGWAGMWLLTRRKVGNWILLNVSNAFAIPLLAMKGLTLLALLTAILFVVACKGYFDWSRKAKQLRPYEL
jgi:nicotinamide mononucleotide transporter